MKSIVILATLFSSALWACDANQFQASADSAIQNLLTKEMGIRSYNRSGVQSVGSQFLVSFSFVDNLNENYLGTVMADQTTCTLGGVLLSRANPITF